MDPLTLSESDAHLHAKVRAILTHLAHFTDLKCPEIEYDPKRFITTAKGLRLHRNCILPGPAHIKLTGRDIFRQNCIIRGDLATIRTGKYCFFNEQCVLHPSFRVTSNMQVAMVPMSIGNYVIIGEETIISGQAIGDKVMVGKRCVIVSTDLKPQCVCACEPYPNPLCTL